MVYVYGVTAANIIIDVFAIELQTSNEIYWLISICLHRERKKISQKRVKFFLLGTEMKINKIGGRSVLTMSKKKKEWFSWIGSEKLYLLCILYSSISHCLCVVSAFLYIFYVPVFNSVVAVVFSFSFSLFVLLILLSGVFIIFHCYFLWLHFIVNSHNFFLFLIFFFSGFALHFHCEKQFDAASIVWQSM